MGVIIKLTYKNNRIELLKVNVNPGDTNDIILEKLDVIAADMDYLTEKCFKLCELQYNINNTQCKIRTTQFDTLLNLYKSLKSEFKKVVDKV